MPFRYAPLCPLIAEQPIISLPNSCMKMLNYSPGSKKIQLSLSNAVKGFAVTEDYGLCTLSRDKVCILVCMEFATGVRIVLRSPFRMTFPRIGATPDMERTPMGWTAIYGASGSNTRVNHEKMTSPSFLGFLPSSPYISVVRTTASIDSVGSFTTRERMSQTAAESGECASQAQARLGRRSSPPQT